MGYTHYWYRHDHTGADTTTRAHAREAYGRLVLDAQRICRKATEGGIIVCNGDGEGQPDFTEAFFSLNGTFVNDFWHENMLWEAVPTIPEWQTTDRYDYDLSKKGVFNFCKTARKPYDAVVTAILIRAKVHYGNIVDVVSDGFWDEWAQGRELYERTFGSQPSCPFSTRT